MNTLQIFCIGSCWATPRAAFIAVIITIVDLVALALLISFNGVFLARTSTCILTSSCSNNVANQPTFSSNFRQNFFSTFNNLNGFKTYTEAQAKYLFQTIQVSFGCLCFVLCVSYLVVYYIIKRRAAGQVSNIHSFGESNTREPVYSGSKQPPRRLSPRGGRSFPERPSQESSALGDSTADGQPRTSRAPRVPQVTRRPPPPRIPQAPPGEVPWNANQNS